MATFRFVDSGGGNILFAPTRAPFYQVQTGRLKNVVSAETLGGVVRSESRGVDRFTLSLEFRCLSTSECRELDAMHATYGGNAAKFRFVSPDGMLPQFLGGAVPSVRWPDTQLVFTCVGPGLFNARMNLVEDSSILVSGTITQANTHLSLVNGTAFADLVGVTIGTYLDSYLVITDSSGRRLAGWLKAAGGGETVDAEMLTNPGFNPDSGWTKETGWTIAGGVAVATGGIDTVIYQATTLTIGRLYKTSFDLVSRTAGSVGVYLTSPILPKQLTPGTYTEYRTATETTPNFCLQGSLYSGTCDNVSLKHVLTPSATGATIVSTRGGTTYNWAYEDTGFNRNDASGYKYAVYSY